MRKGTAYDVWVLDPASSSSGGASASGDQDGFGGMGSSSVGVGAEELNGLSVLLPRKRKGGKLYLGASCALHAFCGLRSQKRYSILFFFSAQRPITRHLVVSARPAKPARPEAACEAPKREAYPDEVLTHRFRPYGDPGDRPREDHMDVDVVGVSPKEKKSKRKSGGEMGSSKKRKTKSAAS